MENLEPKEFQLPIDWDFGDLASRYATNMLIQKGENEFYISFFDITPPLLFSPEDHDKVKSVKANCVSRIIIAKDKLQSFIDALQQSVIDTNNAETSED